MAQWVQGQEFGGDGKLSSCLSLPEQWLRLRDPWPSSERQQRAGKDEVAQLTLLLALGTSLVSHGRFSDDKPEGRKWDRWGRAMEIFPSRAKGNTEHSQKILEM